MKFGQAALAMAMVLLAPPALADDAVSDHDIAAVMARPEYAARLEGMKFYFGNTAPAVTHRIEEGVMTSVRTRKLGRSTEEACQWVMLSAMIQMRDRAVALGGNAVVNVRSNWRNVESSSDTKYQCAAGFLMAGVALKGDVVTLR